MTDEETLTIIREIRDRNAPEIQHTMDAMSFLPRAKEEMLRIGLGAALEELAERLGALSKRPE